MKSISRTTLAVALGAALGAQSVSAQVTEPFDPFDVSQGDPASPAVQVTTPGGTDSNTRNDAPSAGITRQLTVHLNSGLGVRAYVSGGFYHYSQDSGSTSANGTIDWTIPAASCLDWNDVTGLRLVIRNDHPVPISVSVNGASVTQNLAASFNFRDVDFAVGGNSCVTAVRLHIDGATTPDLDLDLDTIAILRTPIVPVPAVSTTGLGLAMLGIPLAAAGLARRRRNRVEKG